MRNNTPLHPRQSKSLKKESVATARRKRANERKKYELKEKTKNPYPDMTGKEQTRLNALSSEALFTENKKILQDAVKLYDYYQEHALFGKDDHLLSLDPKADNYYNPAAQLEPQATRTLFTLVKAMVTADTPWVGENAIKNEIRPDKTGLIMREAFGDNLKLAEITQLPIMVQSGLALTRMENDQPAYTVSGNLVGTLRHYLLDHSWYNLK